MLFFHAFFLTPLNSIDWKGVIFLLDGLQRDRYTIPGVWRRYGVVHFGEFAFVGEKSLTLVWVWFIFHEYLHAGF